MNCLFCKIIAGEIPCHKIYEDEKILAFLDIKPLNPGHTIIVPKKHADHLLETDDEGAAALMKAAKKIAPVIMQSVGAPGCNFHCNVGHAAGQVVFHTHFHVIPRYTNDGFEPWIRKDNASDGLADVACRIRNLLSP